MRSAVVVGLPVATTAYGLCTAGVVIIDHDQERLENYYPLLLCYYGQWHRRRESDVGHWTRLTHHTQHHTHT